MRRRNRCAPNCVRWDTWTRRAMTDAGAVTKVARGMRVLYVEPVGGHRGMHYYDFGLCAALHAQGVDISLVTCDETPTDTGSAFQVEHTFEGVFGSRPRWVRGLHYLRAMVRVLASALSDRPDIVHTHFFLVPPVDWMFAAACRALGIGTVCTVHDVVPYDASAESLRFIGRLYGIMDRLIVHTKASSDELQQEFGVHPARVAIVGLGVPTNFTDDHLVANADAKARLGLPTDTSTVLLFGQVKPEKGLDVLLKAVAELTRDMPNCRLIIAGPLWKESFSAYDRLIADLGLGEHVMVDQRYIPDAEVPKYFCGADVVVLPYRRVYQSGVLLLAQSFGRPVVASAVGGLAEVIRDGETGWLVPAEDHHALAETLRSVLSNREAAEAVGECGKRWVAEQYGWDRLATEIRSCYEVVTDTVRSAGGNR